MTLPVWVSARYVCGNDFTFFILGSSIICLLLFTFNVLVAVLSKYPVLSSFGKLYTECFCFVQHSFRLYTLYIRHQTYILDIIHNFHIVTLKSSFFLISFVNFVINSYESQHHIHCHIFSLPVSVSKTVLFICTYLPFSLLLPFIFIHISFSLLISPFLISNPLNCFLDPSLFNIHPSSFSFLYFHLFFPFHTLPLCLLISFLCFQPVSFSLNNLSSSRFGL